MEDAVLFGRHPIPMLICSSDLRKIYKVNRAAVERYGYSEEEFGAMSYSDLHPLPDKGGSDPVLGRYSGQVTPAKLVRHKTRSGTLFYARSYEQPCTYEDNPAKLITVVDIDESLVGQAEAERNLDNLNQLVESGPFCMIRWDHRLQVIDWPQQLTNRTGFVPNEMVGTKLSELTPFPEEAKNYIRQAAEQEGAVSPYETFLISRRGETLAVRLYAAPMGSNSGGWALTLSIEFLNTSASGMELIAEQSDRIRFVHKLTRDIGRFDDIKKLLEATVVLLCQYLESPIGVVYSRNGSGKFTIPDIGYLEQDSVPDSVNAFLDQLNGTDDGRVLRSIVEARSMQSVNYLLEELELPDDLSEDPDKFRRGIAFPVIVADQIEAIFLFIGISMEDDFVSEEIMSSVQGQLAQAIERIKTLEKLEMNELKYRKLFEQANDGIFIMEGEIFIDCNQRAEELLECSRDQIIGKTPMHFSPSHQPGGKKSEEVARSHIQKAIEGNSQRFHWNHQTALGNLIDTEVDLNRIELRDGIYVQALVRDITEFMQAQRALKRSEELFRNLFLRAPVSMIMVDHQNRVQMVNKNFEKLFGYTEEELLEREVEQFIAYEEDRAESPRMNNLESIWGDHIREFTRITKSGEEVDVLMGIIPVYLEGEPLAGFGIYIDITDQKDAQRMLQTSLQEKEVMLKEIHHRVKNNLAVISALLEIQVMNEKNEHLAEILSDSLLRIRTMALVHETLYQTEDFAKLNLSDYITKLVELNIKVSGTQDRNVNINFDIENIDLNINQAIPCALIFNELVSNVFNFAFEGCEDGDVAIRLYNEDEIVHLLVEDNGIGLPKNFEEMRKKSMGMTLIDQLTAQIHGELNIQSESGGGTLFELIFRKEDRTGSSAHYLP